MDNATDLNRDDWDLDNWLEISNSDPKAKQIRRSKKRRRPLRKNRKPSRPSSYIGQRSNSHLLRMLTERDAQPRPTEE